MSDPVIVFGAGLGGLSAAVTLAQRGIKVLLIEKEPRMGGYAVSYSRRGYTFDLALHAVPAGAAGQAFHNLIGELGLDAAVSFIRLAQGFTVHLGDYTFRMPNNYEELFESLHREFPREKDNLRAFRKDVEGHLSSYAPVLLGAGSKWRSIPPFLLRLPQFLRHASMPVGKYLDKFFSDSRLRAILYQSAVFMGIPSDEFPTINFMMMFHVLIRGGMYTIAGGGQKLTNALTDRLGELGVDVITRARVSKILVERNTAIGVQTDDGVEHRASGVIAAVNTPQLAEELIDPSCLPDSYLRRVRSTGLSLSVLALNVGLDCHPREVGIDSHIAVTFPDDDIDRWMIKQRDSLQVDAFSITAHANSDPAIAPAERSTVSIVAGTSGSKWTALSDEDYRRTKREVTDEIIARAARLYPLLPEHIVVTDLATPATMRRHTNCPSGAIMGFSCARGQYRQVMAISDIPIKRLHSAGAWTKRLGGFMESMRAGVCAAQKLAKTLER